MTTFNHFKVANNRPKVNGKPFVVWSKRWSRYAGRVSGAARRDRTFERDMYICYYRALGVSVRELSEELGLHRNTIAHIVKRDAHKLLTLWEHLRHWALIAKQKTAHIVKNAVWRAQQKAMHNELFCHRGMGGDGRGGYRGGMNFPQADVLDRLLRKKRKYRRRNGLHHR